jgi:hypothetical protein
MNRLDKITKDIAHRHQDCCSEAEIVRMSSSPALPPAYKIPFIQYQAFAERVHYYYLLEKMNSTGKSP